MVPHKMFLWHAYTQTRDTNRKINTWNTMKVYIFNKWFPNTYYLTVKSKLHFRRYVHNNNKNGLC